MGFSGYGTGAGRRRGDADGSDVDDRDAHAVSWRNLTSCASWEVVGWEEEGYQRQGGLDCKGLSILSKKTYSFIWNIDLNRLN